MSFIGSLNGITDSEKSDEGSVAFAKASNDLYLLASIRVLNALHAYQQEMSVKNLNATHELRKVVTQKNLIYEIRRDLKAKSIEKISDFSLSMWTSGKKDRRRLIFLF